MPGRPAPCAAAAVVALPPFSLCAARALVLSLLLALPLGLSGCTGPDREPSREPRKSASPSRSPEPGLLGGPFWVNPDSNPARQAKRWGRQGRTEDAELLERIAEEPVAEWIGGERPGVRSRRFARAADASGSTALLVAYNIPHRDCGQYSTGGALDGRAYRGWLGQFAEGIGERPVLIVLEPDAVTHMVDGCTPRQFHEERYELLREAVRTFKALPDTEVYLDAGNVGWFGDPAELIEPLERAGVKEADGFALNVSNFQTTQASREYGHRISRALGGSHFVIDTSRNGRGPLAAEGHDNDWCNPPDRGLGVPPTRDTGDPLVDAYLWIKRPGESDGECRGAPPAGRWWPAYALELARNAAG